MSDDVLSVIPSDPRWQPGRAAGERAAALASELASRAPGAAAEVAAGVPGGGAARAASGVDVEIQVSWHERITVVDCGANLERITCPLCGGSIDVGWWGDLLEARFEDGFTTLAIEVPCCGGATSLDALTYDWPCGFARFEIAVRNPERAWFSEAELSELATTLGHPVTQVRAHI